MARASHESICLSLTKMCKGLGAREPLFHRRLSAEMRTAAGVEPSDSADVARGKFIAWLEEQISGFESLTDQLLVRVNFNTWPEWLAGTNLVKRREWLAEPWHTNWPKPEVSVAKGTGEKRIPELIAEIARAVERALPADAVVLVRGRHRKHSEAPTVFVRVYRASRWQLMRIIRRLRDLAQLDRGAASATQRELPPVDMPISPPVLRKEVPERLVLVGEPVTAPDAPRRDRRTSRQLPPIDITIPMRQPPTGHSRRRLRPTLVVAALVVVGTVATVATLIAQRGTDDAPPTHTITVSNLVTDGAEMREDDAHPPYLSATPTNFCANYDCKLDGTELRSGARLEARCTVRGSRTTNGDDTSSVDDSNPGLAESTLWYGVMWLDGRFGYISEVWIRPEDRGGLGLPDCRDGGLGA